MPEIGEEVLRELRLDGRATVSALAARLGRSRAAVAQSLRSMTEDGGVRVIAAVDPAMLGQHVLAHVSLRIDGAAAPITERLAAMPETVFVSAVSGDFGVVAEVRVGALPELDLILARARAIPGVHSVSSVIYTEVVRGFFMPGPSEGGRRTPLDATDLSLIELLQVDGRASYEALGRAVSLSPSAVGARVRRLREEGVVKVSVVEARGVSSRRLAMGLGVSCARSSDAVLAMLAEDDSCDFAARTIGRFDAIATLVARSPAALLAALDRVRAVEDVAEVTSWLHLEVKKEDYARAMRPAGGGSW